MNECNRWHFAHVGAPWKYSKLSRQIASKLIRYDLMDSLQMRCKGLTMNLWHPNYSNSWVASREHGGRGTQGVAIVVYSQPLNLGLKAYHNLESWLWTLDLSKQIRIADLTYLLNSYRAAMLQSADKLWMLRIPVQMIMQQAQLLFSFFPPADGFPKQCIQSAPQDSVFRIGQTRNRLNCNQPTAVFGQTFESLPLSST